MSNCQAPFLSPFIYTAHRLSFFGTNILHEFGRIQIQALEVFDWECLKLGFPCPAHR